ncbi:unnamed protein product [Paramecium pentaurelia]|uniref:Uncharacterized protein n=1 Tax=Paramecium pentaurelia TaxID=43138 RepID=A0A8S1T3H6_9CILI|nr:unnamed protein product [Paramecium pentaurelia]
MASNLNEPFIVYKNYRQQQKEAKKEGLKEKIVPKEMKKKIEKPKKNVNPQPTQKKIDQNLLFRVIQQHQQQQQILQQFILDQRINHANVQDDDIDEFSPIYKFGIPTTPQNVALQRRMSRDDDDFKI